MLFGGLCLSSLDATAKYLVRDHSLFLIVWARYAGQMLLVTPWSWHRAGPRFWRTRRLRLQLVRSSFLLAATVCFYAGLRYLPLAEGSAIAFLAPVFIVVLARPILGEHPTRARVLAALLGFAGVLIMLRPGSAVFHPAVAFLLAAAVCIALYNLLTRKLVGEDVRTTLFYTALVGTVATTPALPWALAGESIDATHAGLLLLLGLFAGLGHWALIGAHMIAPASMLTPYSYLQMLWATGFGYVLFRHVPDGWSAAGMAVILGSGLLLAWLERRRPPGAA